jgi:DNA polymerase-3 subunit gamma/tau
MLERARPDDAFRHLTEEVSVDWIQDAILKLNACQQEIKWTNSPKVFIEIALLTITNRHQTADNSVDEAITEGEVLRLTQKMTQLEKQLTALKEQPPASVNQEAPKREPRRAAQRSSKNGFKVPVDQIHDVLKQAEKQELKTVQGNWASFMEKLKKTSAPAHATIQDSKPAAASSDRLVVAFKYEIHCSLFMDNREIVESVMSGVVGKQLQIIPIPEQAWVELRSDFLQSEDMKTEKKEEKPDPFVEEARKLVGDDLLEIQD